MTGSSRSSDGLTREGGGCCSGPGIAAPARPISSWAASPTSISQAFSDAELDQYEHLLDAIETDLLAWVTGVADVPAEHDTTMFRRVRDFHLQA
jgi:hypothetical protein